MCVSSTPSPARCAPGSSSVWLMGVGKMFDDWRSARRPPHRNQVKATRSIMGGSLHQEVPGRPGNLRPLNPGRQLRGVGFLVLRTRFDFDENEGVAIGCNQVNLTDGAAIVLRENTEMLLAQMTGGCPFAPRAEKLARPRRRRVPAGLWIFAEREAHGLCAPCRRGSAGRIVLPAGPCRGAEH